MDAVVDVDESEAIGSVVETVGSLVPGPDATTITNVNASTTARPTNILGSRQFYHRQLDSRESSPQVDRRLNGAESFITRNRGRIRGW